MTVSDCLLVMSMFLTAALSRLLSLDAKELLMPPGIENLQREDAMSRKCRSG